MDSDPLPPDVSRAVSRARDAGLLRCLARRVLFFRSVDSTNSIAGTMDADAEGVVVVADTQTAGRGRRGRRWFSPPGAGLYVSVVLAPGRARRDADRATALLTLSAGVALAEAIELATGMSPAIKWPNDLLIGTRKLAGILAEGISAAGSAGPPSRVVLGYGINIGRTSYPGEVARVATSLQAELGRDVDRAQLLVSTLVCLENKYLELLAGRFDAILEDWRRRAPSHRGACVRWETPSGDETGVTEGIDESGALLVRTRDGVERIVSGAVRWD